MLVFQALLLAMFVGMAGLGVDFAFSTLERRALQNSADAAAITGALNLSQGTYSQAEINTIASQNATTDAGVVGCQYVNTANVDIRGCDGSMTNASGVHVTASHTRETYFMRVLGVPQVTVSADAIARITALQDGTPFDASGALFIVCGYGGQLFTGGTLNILQGTSPGVSPWQVNPAAYDKEFNIHGNTVGDCGAGSNFKGLNGQVGSVTLPQILSYKSGVVAGTTTTMVNGFGGCPIGVDTNCVMILPVAVPQAGLSGQRVAAKLWLPFRIKRTASNEHTGVLLRNFNLNDPLLTWTYAGGNTSGITSVRMAR